MLICLANSYKNSNRCIAGIDLESGEWIRPFSPRDDGAIPLNDPLIFPKRIKLLDLVKISLNPEDKRGYEIENQGYDTAPWQICGQANVIALLQHRESELLYPQFDNCISFDYLQEQIRIYGKVRTLQLIESKSFHCYRNSSGKYRGKIKDKSYGVENFE